MMQRGLGTLPSRLRGLYGLSGKDFRFTSTHPHVWMPPVVGGSSFVARFLRRAMLGCSQVLGRKKPRQASRSIREKTAHLDLLQ